VHLKLLELVIRQFGLQVVEQRSPLVLPQPISSGYLPDRLDRAMELMVDNANERTRAELIVTPILIHLAVTCQLGLYSGSAFNADIESGLSGTVDHLLGRSIPQRSMIVPPITAVVETKSRERGVSHCLVQMVTAQRVNACPDPVYGVVTNGLRWRFLKLAGTTVTIDLSDYPLFSSSFPLASIAPMDVTDNLSASIAPLLSLMVPMVS
jgi:hypothetical protein